MKKEEMISIAKKAIDKNMDMETLMYSDYMYGKESYIEDVWEYAIECKEIGSIAFDKKYALEIN